MRPFREVAGEASITGLAAYVMYILCEAVWQGVEVDVGEDDLARLAAALADGVYEALRLTKWALARHAVKRAARLGVQLFTEAVGSGQLRACVEDPLNVASRLLGRRRRIG